MYTGPICLWPMHVAHVGYGSPGASKEVAQISTDFDNNRETLYSPWNSEGHGRHVLIGLGKR